MRYASIVFLFAFALIAASAAQAQLSIYSYSGPGYSFSDCGSIPGYCLSNGHVSGTFAIEGAPSTGTGGTPVAWSMHGSGVGSLNSVSDSFSGGFTFTDGVITSWGVSTSSADIGLRAFPMGSRVGFLKPA